MYLMSHARSVLGILIQAFSLKLVHAINLNLCQFYSQAAEFLFSLLKTGKGDINVLSCMNVGTIRGGGI